MDSLRKLLPLLLTAVLLIGVAGCRSADRRKAEVVHPPGNLSDQSGEPAFQAFLQRLRRAAARRDIETMATMMTPDFGYSWEPGGEGPGVFDYWNRNRLWKELEAVLGERFVPNGNYMVAPPQVVEDPDYRGYRAGIRLVNGSWRFAYFVPAPPPHLQ